MKHELANDIEICVNITCNALKYSKKWACTANWTDWIDIGEIKIQDGKKIYDNNQWIIYLSQLELTISVNNITKPALTKLYEDSDLTDFQLSTPEGSVAVHKAFLAAHSAVFKTMFTGDWKETKENLIEIKGYSLQTVQHLKDFLYLGTLPDDGLVPLITLAALYSINDLKEECAKKLAMTVLPEDLFSLHELACENNIPELTCAISQLTLDTVINQGYQIEKKKDGDEKKNEEKAKT